MLSWAGVVLPRALTLAALAVLSLPGAATASPPLLPPDPAPPLVSRAPLPTVSHARSADDVSAIVQGLEAARRAGRLSASDVRAHRATLARARTVLARLSGTRRTVLARVVHEVRLQAGAYNRPRALALFSMLRENADLLARRGLPPNETDYVGRGGLVYRVGWGYGLQFHPLANVIALSQHLYAGRRTKAALLASSLAARAVPARGGGAVWEYYFPYAGGRPPWRSGMVQAIGAQVFARVGRHLTAPDFFRVADRSYAAIAGRLVRKLPAGPWIRLYSFSDMLVLNAQLQATLSIRAYGKILFRDGARAFARRLQASSRALLPRFDTSAWTNYIPGHEAPLKYHLYHVELAKFLAKRTQAGFWQRAYERFRRYTREPPAFRAASRIAPLYPWPRDGFRDAGRIAFWVSKISSVSVTVGGASYALGARARGWHSFLWSPGRRAPRLYRPAVAAVDLAGNRGRAALTPVRIAVDRDPPVVRTTLERRTLTWRAEDEATPWLRMRLVVERLGVRRRIDLGRRPLAGTMRLPMPRGTWRTVLWVSDSSGNRTRVPLGPVPRV
ncbi:MAG: hypothetical protein ICV74_08290 [Thermoleophilia bacterium]|nr:hypothetical protein [Thermoleophilia bacterium]